MNNLENFNNLLCALHPLENIISKCNICNQQRYFGYELNVNILNSTYWLWSAYICNCNSHYIVDKKEFYNILCYLLLIGKVYASDSYIEDIYNHVKD